MIRHLLTKPIFFSGLGNEPSTSYMLGKFSPSQPHPLTLHPTNTLERHLEPGGGGMCL